MGLGKMVKKWVLLVTSELFLDWLSVGVKAIGGAFNQSNAVELQFRLIRVDRGRTVFES
jgi:hypothetical protein